MAVIKRNPNRPVAVTNPALLIAMAAGAFVGWITMPGSAAAKGEFPVGLDLANETCTASQGAADDTAGGSGKLFLVQCGEWRQPSVRLFQLPATADAAGLDGLAQHGAWRDYIDQRLICGAGRQTTMAGGAPALILDCKLKNGGWPYVAFATTQSGKVYLGDSIPAALTAAEATIATLATGKAATTAAGPEGSAAVQDIKARLQGHIFGAGDLKTYLDLFKAAQYDDAVRDFGGAEQSFRDALAVHERILGAGNPDSVDVLMNLALVISDQKRFDEADGLFERADQLIAGNPNDNLKARLTSYEAINDANKGNYKVAVALARKATQMRLDIYARYGGGNNFSAAAVAELSALQPQISVLDGAIADAAAIDIVQSLYVEAGILLRSDDPAGARRAVDQALGRLQHTRVRPEWWVPQLYELDAEIAQKARNLPQAEASLRMAAAEWGKIFISSDPEAVTWFALGSVLLDENKRAEALDAFRKGRILLTISHGGLTFDQAEPYIAALDAEASANPSAAAALHAEMFEAAQLVRDNLTARSIALSAARLSASDSAVGALLREKQDADRERTHLQSEYVEISGDPPEIQDRANLAKLRDQVAALDKKSGELDQQVQAASTGYNQLIGSETSAESVLKALGPNEALLFVETGAKSRAFLFHAGIVTPYAVPLSAQEAEKQVAALRRSVIPGDSGKLPKFDPAISRRLYDELLGPATTQLQGVTSLIVAPTGPLLSFPWALLLNGQPTGTDAAAYPWLIKQMALSTVPSPRSFVDLRRIPGASKAAKPFIGFGDFVPAGKLTASDLGLPARCSTDAQRLASLESLPGTRRELQTVGTLLGAGADDLHLRDQFTASGVEHAALDQYRIVYFATHAILPTELDCRSEPLLLASASSQMTDGKRDAGLIRSSDVMALKLDADLVVLSACNTAGAGGRSGGDSLSGLARSFFYAGSRGMLVTHWSVDDDATAALMVGTFKRLQQIGLANGPMALRSAQLDILAQAGKGQYPAAWAHPYFWAAFAYIGVAPQKTVVTD